MKQYGIWLDFPQNKPVDGEKVLIRRKGHRQNWECAVFNEYHECWDDAEGDDFMYYLEDVDKVMFISKIEPIC